MTKQFLGWKVLKGDPRCSECECPMRMRRKNPPNGIDPLLVLFQCPKCKRVEWIHQWVLPQETD